MKNLVNSTKTYERTITKTMSFKGFVFTETQSDLYTELDTFEQASTPSLSKYLKCISFLNKLLNFSLKAEGLIFFYCYLKEPEFINFLMLTAISIGKLLMFN